MLSLLKSPHPFQQAFVYLESSLNAHFFVMKM